MPLALIRRRVGRLEGDAMFLTVAEYPPLTSPEIEAIACRVKMGEPLTREEVERLHRQKSVVGGEFIISASRGNVTVKQYVGVDSAEI
jgi:hypothetical protein